MDSIQVDVWLYGQLSRYGGGSAKAGYAHVHAQLPVGATVGHLVESLQMPEDKRGITFIDGQLSAMPGLQPDLDHVLSDGNRIGMFDTRSMWPFQYRHGAAMVPEMRQAMDSHSDRGLHHGYRAGPDDDGATSDREPPVTS